MSYSEWLVETLQNALIRFEQFVAARASAPAVAPLG